MMRNRSLLSAILAVLLGCNGSPVQDPVDSRADEKDAAPTDMDPPGDMSASKDDLATDPPDLLPPPMLTGVPDCAAATVNATTLYNQVVSMRCTFQYCHGTENPVPNFSFGSAAQMRVQWGRRSRQSGLVFITARNLDLSYVVWKVLGEQGRLGPPDTTGARMPVPPRDALQQADLCLLINWIRGGAN